MCTPTLDWELCDIWLLAMHKLGYEHQIVFFNLMFAYPNPVPQSRDRIYIVFHKKGNRRPNLDFCPPGRCPEHGEVSCIQVWKNPLKRSGKYGRRRNQYFYVCPQCATEVVPYQKAARESIDWSLPLIKIKDREKNGKKPLVQATLRRVERGLKRSFNMSDHRGQNGMQPFISPGRTDNMPTSVDEPTLTWTARNQQWLVKPPAFIDTARSHNVATGIDKPTPTVTTGRNLSVIQPPPFLGIYHGGRDAVRSIDEPSPTVATSNQLGLVDPPKPFISSYYGNGGESSVDSPSPTIRTVQGHCLIEPDWSMLVQECGYRMLNAREAKLLMGFPDDYVILGNQGEQFKQAGNAVTPCTAEMLGRAVMESLS